ncbi:MAG: hypothetical protein ACREK8_04330 [Gemmatimonadales bacterium]
MRAVNFCFATGVLLAFQAAPVVAQQSGHGSDFGLGLRVGTLGGSLELSKLLNSHIGIRVGGNYFSLTKNSLKQSDVTYAVKLKLQSFDGLLDLYPGARGSFHLTAGVISTPLKVDGSGTPTGGEFKLHGNTYTASEVGTLTAEAKFSSALPYLGLGFGSAASGKSHVGFVFDLGVAIGKPKVTLTSSGGTESGSTQLNNDLAGQVSTTNTSIGKIGVYPVLSLGLMIKF